MRILVLTHYYAPEYGAPQRRWSALVSRFIAAGHRVTVAAPVPHYPSGRPTVEQRRDHRVGGAEHGAHGETVLRTAYLPHLGDIGTRTADHLVSALDALWRLRRRFGRPEDRPEVIVATAPAIPTLLVGRLLSARWGVPLVHTAHTLAAVKNASLAEGDTALVDALIDRLVTVQTEYLVRQLEAGADAAGASQDGRSQQRFCGPWS